MNAGLKERIWRLIDLALAPATVLFGPLAVLLARLQSTTSLSRSVLDRFNVAVVRHHYYQPVVFPGDLHSDLDAERQISGLNLNDVGQLELVKQFRYRDELLAIPVAKGRAAQFHYHNGYFESGDAEFLYNIIRHFKPRRIIEVGSGNSTLMARLAVQANRRQDPGYDCEQVCIEPFEKPWLDSLGVRVIRERVELVPVELFDSLEENDILFIDSSHVARPQGDVVHEYLRVIGLLRTGVIVHVHDIRTPRDYLPTWVIDDRKLWNEQYLLEAFLSFNSAFQVICAVNWLWHEHRDKLADACPVLIQEPYREPGSFWFRHI